MPRIDERNVMFSRITRIKGTKEYTDYYNVHPENKEFDDSLRAMAQTIANKTRSFDKLNSPIVDSTFKSLSDINVFVDGEVKTTPKVESSPKIFMLLYMIKQQINIHFRTMLILSMVIIIKIGRASCRERV